MRLRSHLLLFGVALLLPVLVFAGATTLVFARAEREALARGVAASARLLALAVDRELTSSLATLTALATSERLHAGNLPGFHREGQRVVATQPSWRTVAVLDRGGAPVIDLPRLPDAPVFDVAERAIVRAVLAEGRPAISNLLDGREPGDRAIVAAVPVKINGSIRYVVTATLSPMGLTSVLQHQSLVPRAVATVVDGDHRIVARTQRAEEFVGRSVTPALADRVAVAPEGVVRAKNADGEESYGAYSPVAVTGWTVVVSVPASVLEAPLVRSMWTLAAAAALSLLVAVGLAFVFGRRVAGPITALVAAAERVGHGEVPQPVPAAVAEVAAVGHAILGAGQLLRAQDARRSDAESALRQSNQMFEALVSAAPLGILIADEHAIVRLWNPACERIFGWRAHEAVGRFLPPVADDRRDEALGIVRATLAGGGLRGVEVRRRRRDGGSVWISLSTAALPDMQGRPALSLGVIEDITARRRAERHRAAEHAVHAILAEGPPVPVAAARVLRALCRELEWDIGALWRPAGTPPALQCEEVYATSDRFAAFAAFARTCRFEPGAGIPGRIWTEATPLWIADLAEYEPIRRRAAVVEAGLRSAVAFPVLVDRRPVAVLEFFASEGREPDDAMVALLGTVGGQLGQFIERRDAAAALERLLAGEQRARAEAESATRELTRVQTIVDATMAPLTVEELLDELLRRIRQVLGVDTAAIFLVEADALVVRATDGLEAGRDDGPVPAGRGFVGRIAETAKPAVAQDLVGVDLEHPFLERCGIRSLLGAPLLVQGRVTGVIRVGARQPRRFTGEDARLLELVADRVAVALETARLHEAERAARTQAEAANRAKDEFLAMLAHELRNPLAPIRTAVHIIGRLAREPGVRHAQTIVERQVAHLVRLLDDLLDVARITQRKIQLARRPSRVATAVAEAVEATHALVEAKRHALTVAVPDTLLVDADPTRLVQVIANLLNNAAKYTPPGGAIRVEAAAEDGRAVIRVRDNGVGIAPGALRRVFDLFAQGDPNVARSEGGLGVGLTLVQNLVELHGGAVEAHSEGAGRGSEFVLRWPLAAAEPADVPRGGEPGGRRRVLIVEDNVDAAEMLREALALEGHDVAVVHDGVEGVKRSLDERPDVVLVDIGLPVIDGYEVARRVRAALGPEIALVAVSGYGQPHDRERGTAAGFDAYLVKPVTIDRLTEFFATIPPRAA